jgi:hypothetical protein
VALGTALFIHGRAPYVAGSLLAVALCKPHDFYLPLALIAIHIVKTKQIRVVLGALINLLITGLLVEMINPGIWFKWLTRDQWPFVAYGANLTTIMQLMISAPSAHSTLPFACVSAALGALVWRHGCSACSFTSLPDRIMWAWLVTPFFAPYGFFSDQVTLLFPFSYFTNRVFALEKAEQGRFFKRFGFIFTVCATLFFVRSQPIPLSWLLYAPLIVLLVFTTFSRNALGSQTEP